MALLNDGTVKALTNKDTPFGRIPEDAQGRTIDIASTDRVAAALLDDNTVVVLGSMDYRENLIPEEAQGKTAALMAGRNHFTALLDDGSVVSWGRNDYNQTDVPKLSNVSEVFTSYHQNYAVDTSGKITSWGMKGYLMGTDQFGRDVFLRLIYAGRMTMTVGAIAVLITAVIGILLGGFSGYYGGALDILVMRIGEVIDSIPFYPLAIVLSAIIGNSLSQTGRIIMIMCILGFLGWPGMARLVRAQILSERESEYVTAAKAMGIREFAVIFRHILPNILPIILVRLTLSLATSMLTESGLSFLGFGVREPNPTWGNMLNSCIDSKVIADYWWRWLFPSIALGLSTLSINMVGDGMRDAIDPKSNDR
jgi:peptide/nickel transport system permease protein